jgi:dTDP-4-amino-4,6-dideoxygalactose transaminase
MMAVNLSKSDRPSIDAGRGAASPIQFIDLGVQLSRIRDRIDRAIARVLDHGQFIMGPEVGELEAQLAAFTGAKHVISCASGTDALLIAMMSLNLGRGDAVLCPSFTFTATPEAIALLGATPIFVDVDPVTFNIDPAALASGLEAARKHGLKPAGVIAVDLFGLAADYGVLEDLAQQNALWLLADAAQSFGASRDGRKVGEFGAITATSFFPAKPLGCYGDGGAMFTNNAELAARMESIRLHGRGRADKYEIERIGVNGRLDTIQAAILIEKLALFSKEIEMRQAVAQRYDEGLSDLVVVPHVPAQAISAWAQYTIQVPENLRAPLMARLKSDGVPTAVYYPRPLHHQSAYKHFPVAANGLPNSERLAKEVLSLPMHPYLDSMQQDRIIDSMRRAIEHLSS